MVFYDVLELGLEGCGTSMAAEERSDGFSRRLAAEHRLLAAHPANTKRGRQIRRSQLYTGVLNDTHLFQKKKSSKMRRLLDEARRGVRLPNQCPRIRAWLQHFGILLATKAGESLSTEWREAAKRWPELTCAEKKSMLDRVSRSLAGPLLRGARLQAVWENGPEAILPINYGKHTPSCLGKAQVLAGFARLAGAPSILFVPVIETAEDAAPAIRDGAGMLAKFLGETGIATDFLTVRSLMSKESEARQRIECPSWLHGIVALPTAKFEWQIVDPNLQRLDGVMFGWHLDGMARSHVRRLCVPGLTSCEMSLSRHQYPSLLEELEDTIAAAGAFNAALQSAELSPDSLAELVLRHRLGKPLAKYCGGAANTDVSLRGMKLCLAHLGGNDTIFTRRPSDEDLEHLLPSGALLSLVARRIPHAATFRTFKDIEDRETENCERRPFPVMEYGPSNYLLAVHTLAHLGSNYGVSDALEPTLATHCFSQWRTWYAACSQDPASRPIASFAALVMSHIYADMRLHSATRGLGEVLARFQNPEALRFPIEEYSLWTKTKAKNVGQPRRSSRSCSIRAPLPTTSEKRDPATRSRSTS